jgi:hypothetical protein
MESYNWVTMERRYRQQDVIRANPANIKTLKINVSARNVSLGITKTWSDSNSVPLVRRDFLPAVLRTLMTILESQNVTLVYVVDIKLNKALPIVTNVFMASIKIKKVVLNVRSVFIMNCAIPFLMVEIPITMVEDVVTVLTSLPHVWLRVQTIHTTPWFSNVNGVHLDIIRRMRLDVTTILDVVKHNAG